MKVKGTIPATIIREKDATFKPSTETSSDFLKKLTSSRIENKPAEDTLNAELKPASPLIQEIQSTQKKKSVAVKISEPKYNIVHQGLFDFGKMTSERTKLDSGRPDSLMIKIELPKVVSVCCTEI